MGEVVERWNRTYGLGSVLQLSRSSLVIFSHLKTSQPPQIIPKLPTCSPNILQFPVYSVVSSWRAHTAVNKFCGVVCSPVQPAVFYSGLLLCACVVHGKK